MGIQLNSCCFVFDLKTGCLIMGGINAMLSFIMLCVMIVFAAAVGSVDSSNEFQNDVEMQAAITGLYAMCIILSILFLIKFSFDIVFIWGVHAERSGVIKTYMIMWIVFFLLSMFIFFLNSPHFNAGTIVTELLYICHNVYTILLSYSFQKQLNSREEV